MTDFHSFGAFLVSVSISPASESTVAFDGDSEEGLQCHVSVKPGSYRGRGDMRAMSKSLATGDTPIGATRPASTRRIRAVGRPNSRGDHEQLRNPEARPACPGVSGPCRGRIVLLMCIWPHLPSRLLHLCTPRTAVARGTETFTNETFTNEISTRSFVVRLRSSGGASHHIIRVHRGPATMQLYCTACAATVSSWSYPLSVRCQCRCQRLLVCAPERPSRNARRRMCKCGVPPSLLRE